MRLADTAEGNCFDQRFARRPMHVLRHRGFDQPGCEGADANAEGGELTGPGDGIGGERGFGGDIVGLAAVAVAREGRHVDDDAGFDFVRGHFSYRIAHYPSRAGQVDVNDGLPLRAAHGGNLAAVAILLYK